MTVEERQAAVSLIVMALGITRDKLTAKTDDEVYAILQQAQRFITWEG